MQTFSGDPLTEIARALRKANLIAGMKMIKHARVPIIKMRERLSGLNVDLSFDVDNGPRNTEIVKKFNASYPQLKSLLLVLKTFLRLRGLNETFTGGVGSYLLTNLVIAHIQHRVGSQCMSLGEQLLDFLLFYGRLFNFASVGISILEGGTLYQKVAKEHSFMHV